MQLDSPNVYDSEPTQKLFSFENPVIESHAARYEPSDDALAAYERLECFLRDARDRPINDLAEEALRFLARAMVDTPPKRAYSTIAEDRLQAIQASPDTVGIKPQEEAEFLRAVDDCLDCLHEMMLVEGRGR